MTKQFLKYFLLLNFLFLFGFSHASATSVDILRLDHIEASQAFAAELNFYCYDRSTESISESAPLNHRDRKAQHPLLFLENEKEEDDDKLTSYDQFLKCSKHCFSLLYLSELVSTEEGIRSQVTSFIRESNLSSDEFLYLELQVFRI